MRIVIDTERQILTAGGVEHALDSAEAFRALSEVWLRSGLQLGHWTTVSWMGRQLVQLPDDALRLAEVVWRLAPDAIIECGVYEGGLSLLLASVCRMRDRGRVIGVEVAVRPGVREALAEAAVTLVEGDSAAPETVGMVRSLLRPGERVMVVLDSDHSRNHVLAELEQYAPLVTPGSYIVVADTILTGSDTPLSAVSCFFERHREFSAEPPEPVYRADTGFGHISYFEHGWLRRR
jgi:cephalosporin hydroxylase